MELIDLRPATEELARVVQGVRPSQLAARTPCSEMNVGTLLDHIANFALAFTWAASKSTPLGMNTPPTTNAADLPHDWQTLIPARLEELADAWAKPDAWDGEAQAGGVTLDASEMGLVALDEVVVHGWDLAKATDQVFGVDDLTSEVLLGYQTEMAQPQYAEMRNTIFGPVVEVDDSAPELDRIAGLAGRHPNWHPSTHL